MSAHANPIPVQKGFGGLWGYLDEDLDVLMEPQYADATEFDGGVAVVETEEGSFQIIDEEGNRIAVIETDYAYAPSDGMIRAKQGDEWGYYDYQGRLKIEGLNRAGDFQEGKACVKMGDEVTYIDKDGRNLFSGLSIDGGYPFSNGIARVYRYVDWPVDVFGIIDKNGNFVTEPKFYDLNEFSEELAAAGFTSFERSNRAGNYGYIDRRGNVVIEGQYYYAHPFSNGVALVRYKKIKKGATPRYFKIIDRHGNTVRRLDEELRVLTGFRGGLAAVARVREGEYEVGLMDCNGDIVVEPQFDSDTYYYSNGYWQLFTNEDLRPVLVDAFSGKIVYLDEIFS
ncbi:MAG: WG repeat-containing protein [Spirochaetia bacterium]